MKQINLALLAILASSCYLNNYPVTTSVVSRSTYKAINDDGSGTAWAVSEHELVTAGHMCHDINGKAVGTMTLMSPSRSFTAHPIVWGSWSDDDARGDLCVLHTDVKLDNHLVISQNAPVLHEAVGIVGYPLGQYLESSGEYIGDLDGPSRHENDDVVTAASDHGGSGSAVFTTHGVIGIVVRCVTAGEIGCRVGVDGAVITPLSELKKILDDAEVDYEVTPEDPENLK